MNVVVEPDPLSAWTGLAGVALGGGIGAAASLLPAWFQGRRERQETLERAASDLSVTAQLLHFYTRGASLAPPDTQQLEWTCAIAEQIRYLLRAADTVARLALAFRGAMAAERCA